MQIYGPYSRKDGRQHVILIDDGKRRTVSYPKYLMEQHLGRALHPDLETVDHIDGDFTNNELSNLRVIDRVLHALDDCKRVEPATLTCIWCGNLFERRAADVHNNAKHLKAGPFCSRTCTGKYGASVQNGGDKLPVQQGIDVSSRTYYTWKTKNGTMVELVDTADF